MLIALLVFLGFLLLMLASGAYIFCVACCRTKNVNWLDEKAVEGTPFAEHYSKIVACDRWLKESGCRDIFVTASDGIRLHALWTISMCASSSVPISVRVAFTLSFGIA